MPSTKYGRTLETTDTNLLLLRRPPSVSTYARENVGPLSASSGARASMNAASGKSGSKRSKRKKFNLNLFIAT